MVHLAGEKGKPESREDTLAAYHGLLVCSSSLAAKYRTLRERVSWPCAYTWTPIMIGGIGKRRETQHGRACSPPVRAWVRDSTPEVRDCVCARVCVWCVRVFGRGGGRRGGVGGGVGGCVCRGGIGIYLQSACKLHSPLCRLERELNRKLGAVPQEVQSHEGEGTIFRVETEHRLNQRIPSLRCATSARGRSRDLRSMQVSQYRSVIVGPG